MKIHIPFSSPVSTHPCKYPNDLLFFWHDATKWNSTHILSFFYPLGLIMAGCGCCSISCCFSWCCKVNCEWLWWWDVGSGVFWVTTVDDGDFIHLRERTVYCTRWQWRMQHVIKTKATMIVIVAGPRALVGMLGWLMLLFVVVVFISCTSRRERKRICNGIKDIKTWIGLEGKK